MTSTLDYGFTKGDALVVTGAGSGIGKTTALLAAGMGLGVAAWDLHEDTATATVERIEAASGQAIAVRADVSRPEDVAAAFARTADLLGPVRYLVNNAGPSSATEIEFDRALELVIGSIRLVTETWLSGEIADDAALVNIASVAGNLVATASDWYTAAKAAVAGYTRHLAAYRSDEVRSNIVAPGMTDTPRLAGFAASDLGKRVLQRIPLNRMAASADIAHAVLFLLSPPAGYINGAFLTVDGGWTITQ